MTRGLGSAALVLAAAAAACGRREAEPGEDERPATARVACAVATPAPVEELVEVAGTIAPPPRVGAVVSAPVAGRVAQVLVEEGDVVPAGAVLAVVEDPALPAGRVEAGAALAAAEAGRAAAQLEVARQERLVAAGIGARRELDDARARAAAAAAEVEAAGARRGLAVRQLARRELRAPRGGTVLHVWRRVGESVDGTPATPVAEVADLAVLEAHADAPPAALAPLREGMSAVIRPLGSPAVLAATVARIAPAVDPATQLGRVRLRLAAGGAALAGLRVGGAVAASIVVGRRQGVVVPAAAMRRSAVGADEVVVCDHGVARVRAVEVGQRTARGVELVAGLAAGERFVVERVLGLEDGQPLEEAGAAGAPPAPAVPVDGAAGPPPTGSAAGR